MTDKACIRCNKIYPSTIDFFNVNRAKNDGLTAQCKQCRAALWKEQYARHGEKYLNRIKDKNAPLKLQKALCKSKEPIICKKCGTEYKAKEGNFYIKKSGGFQSPCIQCFIKSSRERHDANKERINSERREKIKNDPEIKEKKRISDAKDYARHKDKRLASMAEYRTRPEVKAQRREYLKTRRLNPEFVESKKEYLQQYHAEKKKDPLHSALLKQKSLDYWKSNREKYRAHVRNRRAKIRSSEGAHTAEDVLAKINEQNGLCYYCRCDIGGGKHTVDHYIPIAKGGSNGPENIVIACSRCNCSKSDKMPDEFISYLAKFAA